MSEQKRYTAQEMREMAKSMAYGEDESSMEFVVAEVGDNLTLKESVEETNMVAAMLRQASDAEEELAQLKERLEAVVKELEDMRKYCAFACVDQEDVDAILRAARGEGGAK